MISWPSILASPHIDLTPINDFVGMIWLPDVDGFLVDDTIEILVHVSNSTTLRFATVNCGDLVNPKVLVT
jgi:hypothetical protein